LEMEKVRFVPFELEIEKGQLLTSGLKPFQQDGPGTVLFRAEKSS